MQAGETVTDVHGRTWEVVSLEPIEEADIQNLLRRESVVLGQVVHVPVTRAALRLKQDK